MIGAALSLLILAQVSSADPVGHYCDPAIVVPLSSDQFDTMYVAEVVSVERVSTPTDHDVGHAQLELRRTYLGQPSPSAVALPFDVDKGDPCAHMRPTAPEIGEIFVVYERAGSRVQIAPLWTNRELNQRYEAGDR